MRQSFADRLKSAMEQDKLYLDPKLNLKRLSRRVGIHSRTISSVLSSEMQTSFNRFINSYRIKTLEQKLSNENYRQLTIAGMAMECGFNSQPTFQRVFKMLKGESPTQFIRKRKTLHLKTSPDR